MAATIVINDVSFDAIDCDNVGNVLFEKNCGHNVFKKELDSEIECKFYYFGNENVYCKFLMLEELSEPSDIEYDVEKYNRIIHHKSVGTPIPENFRLWECNVSGVCEDDHVYGSTLVQLDELLLPTTKRIVILGKIMKRSEEQLASIGNVMLNLAFELASVGLVNSSRICKFVE
jgi:hypothetical protein